MNMDAKVLRRLTRSGHERALARLALASRLGRGIRLTAAEVDAIFMMDHALHQRLYNEAFDDDGKNDAEPNQKEKQDMARNRDSDMLVVERAFFDNLTRDNCEYGGIGLDDKRPFGNSDPETDILELIGAKPEGDDGERECYSSKQRAYAADLYDSLIDHLQAKYGSKKG